MIRMRMRRHHWTSLVLAGMLAATAPTGPAAAHPHVWVTVESVIVYERGSMTGIRHTWSFDEMYTTMAIQGLDTNNDGTYDRAELAELARVNMEGLKEFAYFTHVKLAGQALALEDARDAYLDYVEASAQGASEPDPPAAAPKDDSKPGVVGRVQSWFSGNGKDKPAPKPKVLRLHFTLPLQQPVLAEAPGFSFSVSDPTFFIALELAKHDPVKLGAGAPAGCRIVIGGTGREAEDTQRLEQAFANQVSAQGFGLGAGLAKPAAVVCEPKS
jgi:ABC-type uncharacterized transport system substrate-binding protein